MSLFSCSSCLRRTLIALTTRHSERPLLSPLILYRRSVPRNHSTVQSIRKGHHRSALVKALKSKKPLPLNKVRIHKDGSKLNIVERRDIAARANNRHHLDRDPESTAEWRVRNWLQDPLKLATAVLQNLRDGQADEALELVRASERKMKDTNLGGGVDNVVSWNHLIDWHMHQEDPRMAFRIYNEMKKRGHKPDAHSYTIMLRGFTDNVKKPNAVKDAVNIYNSIFAPNSAVTPNIIHTNAIINCCAKGRDMDALWSVAGRLPERGPGAPDKWTYTTILNAIRISAEKNATKIAETDGNEDQSDDIFDAAVTDGRKLWEDIVKKWRAGDLMVDEPLVCAMGRLLLLSAKQKDWMDVFALVEQTMKIERKKGLERQLPAANDQERDQTSEQDGEKQDISVPAATNEFAPITISSPRSAHPSTAASSSAYATPGNNALSMIMQAALLTKSTALGKEYYATLTSTSGLYTVMPDHENLAVYLRLLRVSRSSRAVLDLLRLPYLFTEPLSSTFWKRGVFVIAMSTCVRDKNNANVFDHASAILDLMQEKLGLDGMDPKVMEMYVSLALVTTPGISHVLKGHFDPDPRTNNAMRAVARLGPLSLNVKSLIKKKVEDEERDDNVTASKKKRNDRHAPTTPESKAQLGSFLATLIGAYDRLRAQGEKVLGADRLVDYTLQKKKLSAFVTKMLDSVDPPGRKTFNEDAEDNEVEKETERRIQSNARGVPIMRPRSNVKFDQRSRPTRRSPRQMRQGEVEFVSHDDNDQASSRTKAGDYAIPDEAEVRGRREHKLGRQQKRGNGSTDAEGNYTFHTGWGTGYDRLARDGGGGRGGVSKEFVEVRTHLSG